MSNSLFTRPQLVALACCAAATMANDRGDVRMEGEMLQACDLFGEGLEWMPDCDSRGTSIVGEGHYQWEAQTLWRIGELSKEQWVQPEGHALKYWKEAQLVALALCAAATMTWWNDDEDVECTLDGYREEFEEFAERLGMERKVLRMGWHYPQVNGKPVRGAGHHQWTDEQLRVIAKIPASWLHSSFSYALITPD